MNLKICVGILAAVLAIAVAIWFVTNVPGARNARVIASHSLEAKVDVPRNVEVILVRSCKDCHSNETRWPWYSRLPMISGLVQDDVRRGRSHMNLSEWNRTESLGQDEERGVLNGICEELRSGDMPSANAQRVWPDGTRSRDCLCMDGPSRRNTEATRECLRALIRLIPDGA